MKNYKNVVDQIRELQRMREEIDAEITALQDQIKADMTEEGTDTFTGVDYKITWKAATRATIDSKALKHDLPEVAAQYTKVTEYRRFLIA